MIVTLVRAARRYRAVGLGCMGMSGMYGTADRAREHRDHPRRARRRHQPARHRRLLRHGPQRAADRRGARGPRPRRGRDQRQVRRPARARTGAWLGYDARPAGGQDRARLLTEPAADAITSTSTAPRGSIRNVPIEETVGAIAELVEAGYVRHIGLSEVGVGDDPPRRRRPPDLRPADRVLTHLSRHRGPKSSRRAASSASGSRPTACSRAG